MSDTAIRISALVLVVATSLLAGCGGSSIPKPPIGLGVPYGYRTTHVWRADLSGQSVQDAVVASVGPPVTFQGFHSRDIRVLEWDPLAHQWSVAFDAQKVIPQPPSGPGSSNEGPGFQFNGPSSTPLLDPKADVYLGPVRFVRLLSGRREQLAFSASSSYGGSGVPGILAVVDFKGGIPNVVYTWSGEGLMNWRVDDRVLTARAEYWTATDAHCCPVGAYTFAVAEGRYGIDETNDSRPWLGVTVRSLTISEGLMGPMRITEIAGRSPAAGRLRVGDVLVGLLNHVKAPKGFSGGATRSLPDKLVLLRPGDTARLVVKRNGVRIVVPVKLASMRASFAQDVPNSTGAFYAAL